MNIRALLVFAVLNFGLIFVEFGLESVGLNIVAHHSVAKALIHSAKV